MKALPTLLLFGALLAGGPLPVAGAAAGAASVGVRADGWRARAVDNVCGLSDLRMLSNPAVVRFDQLVKLTPEMKKLVREGIDPASAEGVQLRNAARKRVTKACEAVRVQRGHCSVWRAIRHTGGKKAAEITTAVRAKL